MHSDSANAHQLPASERHRHEILEVIAHYRTYHRKAIPKPRSTSLEWRKCRDRLAEGFSVADLKRAIDGIHLSTWHIGKDPKSEGKTYLDLDLALRDASQVNKFMEIAEKKVRESGNEQGDRQLPDGAQYLLPNYPFKGRGGLVVTVVGNCGGYKVRGPDGLCRVFEFVDPIGSKVREIYCEPGKAQGGAS